jgi:hypothetical protein
MHAHRLIRKTPLTDISDFKKLCESLAQMRVLEEEGYSLEVPQALILWSALKHYKGRSENENDRLMLTGALDDFLTTWQRKEAQAMGPGFAEEPIVDEDKAWNEKRDAIMREIFTPKSRVNVWGDEVPVEVLREAVVEYLERENPVELKHKQVEKPALPPAPLQKNLRGYEVNYYEPKVITVYDAQGIRKSPEETKEIVDSPLIQYLVGADIGSVNIENGMVTVQVKKPADFITMTFTIDDNDVVVGSDEEE